MHFSYTDLYYSVQPKARSLIMSYIYTLHTNDNKTEEVAISEGTYLYYLHST